MPLLSISRSDVHVWQLFTEDFINLSLLKSYERLLSEEEKLKINNFFFDKDKIQHILSRSLLRTVLSYYCNIKAHDLLFTYNPYGKPQIANDDFPSSICFNVSHCKGAIVCIIAMAESIGIDIENIENSSSFLEIAQNFLSESEYLILMSLPPPYQKNKFFEYWTLKEAFLKGSGKGLSINPNKICFEQSNRQKISVSFDDDIQEDNKQWQFALFELKEEYQVAVAIKDSLNFSKKFTFKILNPAPDFKNFVEA